MAMPGPWVLGWSLSTHRIRPVPAHSLLEGPWHGTMTGLGRGSLPAAAQGQSWPRRCREIPRLRWARGSCSLALGRAERGSLVDPVPGCVVAVPPARGGGGWSCQGAGSVPRSPSTRGAESIAASVGFPRSCVGSGEPGGQHGTPAQGGSWGRGALLAAGITALALRIGAHGTAQPSCSLPSLAPVPRDDATGLPRAGGSVGVSRTARASCCPRANPVGASPGPSRVARQQVGLAGLCRRRGSCVGHGEPAVSPRLARPGGAGPTSGRRQAERPGMHRCPDANVGGPAGLQRCRLGASAWAVGGLGSSGGWPTLTPQQVWGSQSNGARP